MPVWFILIKLSGIIFSIAGYYPLVLHKQIDDKLGIQDGQTTQFEEFEFGQEYSSHTKVLVNLYGDFLIHDAFELPEYIASNTHIMMDKQSTCTALPITGAKFCLPNQEVFME